MLNITRHASLTAGSCCATGLNCLKKSITASGIDEISDMPMKHGALSKDAGMHSESDDQRSQDWDWDCSPVMVRLVLVGEI